MMKKNLNIALLITMLCPILLRGQCIDNDNVNDNKVQNIKTIPIIYTVNQFDWRALNAPIPKHYNMRIPDNSGSQTVSIDRLSPYFWLQGNASTVHLQSKPDNEKDFEPSKGWELLTYYFGGQSDPLSAPYIILYNRYSSVLRAFFYIRTGYSFAYNSGRIDMKFIYNPTYHSGGIQKESALLSLSKTPIKALDKFNKNVISSALIRTNSDGNFWLYADFPMAYDACTCNYLSQIEIKPVLIKTSKVELIQDDITQQTVQGPNPTNSTSVSPVITGFQKGLETNVGKLTGVGKSIKSSIDILEGLAPNQFVYDTKKTTIFNEVPGVDDYIDLAKIKTDKRLPFKFPEEVKEAAGIFGVALGVIELMFGGDTQTPTVAAKGLKYKISGVITDDLPLTPAIVFTPGSNWPNNTGLSLAKPIYNNTLGIFNLTETPRINYSTFNITTDGTEYEYRTVNNGSIAKSSQYNYVNWNFKLLDDIKYSVNPASGYKPQPVDLKAALVFSVNAKCLNNDQKWGEKFPPFCTFSSPWSSSLKIVRNKNPDGKLSDTATITTPLMPISCLKEYVARLTFVGNSAFKTTNTFPSYSNAPFKDDVRLLIMANLEREDDPKKQFLYTAQYQLFPELSNQTILSTALSNIELNPVYENLNLTSDLTIRAWETVKFKGTVTTNGFKLTVIVGSEVNFEDLSRIPANTDINIGVPTECQGSIPSPQTPSQLYSFCAKAGTKKYNPDAPASLVANDNSQATRASLVSFNISPNPFTNQLTIDLNIEEATNANLDLSNAVGQTLKSRSLGMKEKGSYQETIETDDLVPGIYFLTLRTQNGTETKKIVKQ